MSHRETCGGSSLCRLLFTAYSERASPVSCCLLQKQTGKITDSMVGVCYLGATFANRYSTYPAGGFTNRL